MGGERVNWKMDHIERKIARSKGCNDEISN